MESGACIAPHRRVHSSLTTENFHELCMQMMSKQKMDQMFTLGIWINDSICLAAHGKCIAKLHAFVSSIAHSRCVSITLQHLRRNKLNAKKARASPISAQQKNRPNKLRGLGNALSSTNYIFRAPSSIWPKYFFSNFTPYDSIIAVHERTVSLQFQ